MKKKKIILLLLIFVIGTFITSYYLLNPTSGASLSSKINSLVFESANTITSLDTPTGLTWKDESTATAIWDAVENANYYIVNVLEVLI